MPTASGHDLSEAFQTILDYFPSGISLVDHNLDLVAWNKMFRQIFDFPDSLFEPHAPNMYTLFRFNADRGDYGPGDPEELAQALLARCKLMQAHIFERTTPNDIVLEVRGLPLPNGGFVSIYTDITQRKQAEIQYRATLENASVGIIFTKDRKVQHCNPKAAEMFGWDSPADLTGQPGTVFWVSDELYAQIGRNAGAVLASGETYSIETTMRRKDGSTFLADIRAKSVNSAMLSAGTIWIAEDVTDKRAAEKVLADRTDALQAALTELGEVITNLERTQDELIRSEKLAALGALVAGVAHELNTPIGNSIMVASHLRAASRKLAAAKSDEPRPQVMERYREDVAAASDILVRNLHRAGELVSSFKQVAVDQTSSRRRRFDLAEVVAEVVLTMSASIRTKCVIEQDVPAGLVMDSFPGPLGQVLSNLINNAILHGLAARKTGIVRISATPMGSDKVALVVADDGAGIPSHIIPRIFDPFFTTTRGAGGSGLGLNIVHNIVEGILGGRITVESQVGEGSRFTTILPCEAPAAKAKSTVSGSSRVRGPEAAKSKQNIAKKGFHS